MPTSRYLPARRLRSSGNAPSSANLGDLPVDVHAAGEPRVVNGELDNQRDGLDYALNPLESSNHLT